VLITQQLNKAVISNRIGALFWLLIFGLTFAWRLQNLDAFGLSNDEGVYLMWARLVVEGHPLYSETYAVQPPLFIESLGLAFRLAGQTLQTGRWAMLTGYILLAFSLSWLAYRAGRWGGALIALSLLGVAPLIFTYSRLAMAEVPATALAVTSLVTLLLYRDKGQRGWLIASGLLLGLSFITKALNPFLVVPATFVLFLHPRSARLGQSFLIDLALWSAPVVVPVAAIFVFYEPAATYDQLVAFRGDLRNAIPGSWPETWRQFGLFINSHWGFWLLAFGGIISTVLRVWQTREGGSLLLWRPPTFYNLIWLIWLSAGVVMLGWHAPLFFHHLIVLLPPLILLGAALPSNLIALWPKAEGLTWTGYSGIALLLLILLAAISNIPAMVAANQETAAIVTGGREQEALRFLKTVSNPNDFLMGDSQLLIFMAERRTPPPLGDLALVGIKAGRQTSSRMIKLTQAYEAPAVVQWSLRLPWLPEYLTWVQANYLAKRVWDNDHIIYFGQRWPASQSLPHERQARLGEGIILRGYQTEPGPLKAGDSFNFKIYWQTDRPLAKNYTVFTQLLDNRGSLVAGYDSQPLGGYFPTSQWPAHEIVTDQLRLPLPADLPAGSYTLIIGMYLLETLERLPVLGSPDSYVIITTLEIKE
jgi:4-amino-4-deoxy-L-arabinose transferase-like glycosyltransferase